MVSDQRNKTHCMICGAECKMKLCSFMLKGYLGFKWPQQSSKASDSPFCAGASGPLTVQAPGPGSGRHSATDQQGPVSSLVLQSSVSSFSHLDSVSNMDTIVPSESCHQCTLQGLRKAIGEDHGELPLAPQWGYPLNLRGLPLQVLYYISQLQSFLSLESDKSLLIRFKHSRTIYFHLLSLPSKCLRVPSCLHCK